MNPKPLIPERLVHATVGDLSYELWRTPTVRHMFHLYVFQHGVEVNKIPFDNETRGRIEFERRVEREVSKSAGNPL